ncbi:DUF6221 family protein [Streptomyces sp. NPDC004042]|uniref:DUF6221 family protein n=1 Tax=Streptomyces sp. NPDC004042 TaxID=3154451 RepID=UPI0033B329A9
MDDLVQWLRVQLDEDEQIARAASGGPWMAWAGPEKPWQNKGELIHPVQTVDHTVGEPPIMTAVWFDSRHIAEWDPARVLREIDTKRRTVELCAQPLVDVTGPGGAEPTFIPGEGPPWGLDVLRLLALPYADRPGYQEEWRP